MKYDSVKKRCDSPSNTECPINNSKLWARSSTTLFCSPITAAGCEVLGLIYNSGNPSTCSAPATYANC